MAASSLVEEVEDVLMCQVCMYSLVERSPRTLQCLHTFCTSCLESTVAKSQGSQDVISCPLCRQNTELPDGKVKNLPLNFSIEQTNEMVRSLGKVELCNTCWANGEFVHGAVKCVSCDRRLCVACNERHDKIPGFQSHQKTNINITKQSNNPDMCRKHRSEYIRFCHECHLFLCVDCLLSGGHDTHHDSIDDIPLVAQKIRKIIDERLDVLTKNIAERSASLGVYLIRKSQYIKVKQEIEEFAEGLKASIDKNKELLLQELTDTCEKISDNGVRVIQRILDKENEVQESLLHCKVKSDSEIINYKENMMRDEKDPTSMQSELDVLKEPPLITFEKSADPIFGRLVSHESKCVTGGSSPEAVGCSLPPATAATTGAHQEAHKPQLIRRFDYFDAAIGCGIGALSNGRAVVVSEDNEALILLNAQTGRSFRIRGTRWISSVSTFDDRILCGDGNEDIMFEVNLFRKRMEVLQEYFTGCSEGSFDGDGNIIATDGGTTNHVMMFSADGKLLWKNSIQSSDNIRLGIHPNNRVYIISYGKSVKLWNEKGRNIGKLNIVNSEETPDLRGTAVTPADTILVADCANHHISEYRLDGSFIRHLLTEEDGIIDPCDISCDKSGRLWVMSDNFRVAPCLYQM